MSKILIVDDSPAQLFNLRRIVEGAGHHAVTADCGERALELAQLEQPAVILMDIIMPGMSGYQAKRRLDRAASTRSIPVIFVSNRCGEADRVWGMRQGARDKESRFPAPACGGRRLHRAACNERTTPLVPLASLRSPNRGRRVACGSYVTKPIDPAALLSAISGAMAA